MSDLAKELLSEYYGIGVESAGSKFVSIPECRKNVTNEYKRSIDEQTSSITEEKDSSIKQDSQEQFDDNECTDEKNNNFARSTRALTHIDSDDDLNQQSDTFDADLGSNVIFDTLHSPLSPVQVDKGNTPDDVPVDIPKGISDVQENGDVNNGNHEVINGMFPDNTSDVSWHVQSKKSQKSLISFTTPLPPVPKKGPVYNKTFVDLSNTELTVFPIVLFNRYSSLRMLYLEKNSLTELPDQVFSVLRQLEWLDVRNNQIKYLPVSIKSHPCLETLLLNGNNIEKLPLELCSVMKLKTLHVVDNPIIEPPKDIVAQGCSAIVDFLRSKWNKLHPDEIVEIRKKDIQPTLHTIICYKPLSSSESNRKFENLRSAVSVSRKVSTRERSRSYKPSNRYKDRMNFLPITKRINNCPSRKCTVVKTLCKSCTEKIAREKFNSNDYRDAQVQTDNTHCQYKVNKYDCKKRLLLELICDAKGFSENSTPMKNKILRLHGPSPRSLYIRKNITCLKTFNLPSDRKCTVKTSGNELKQLSSKGENYIVPVKNNEKYSKPKKTESVFDIVTIDARRLKLQPMHLKDPDWILTFLFNYLGLRCRNTRINSLAEQRELWFCQIRKTLTLQESILQKIKNEYFLKRWRQDKRSFAKSMEKSRNRNKGDFPFAGDVKNQATSKDINSRGNAKCMFLSPVNVDTRISELADALKEIETSKDPGKFTSRTGQAILQKNMDKISQVEMEIRYLKQHIGLAM